MKKDLLLFIYLFFSQVTAFNQTIDSIVVSTDSWASDVHGFMFNGANVDSFSNGRLIDSVMFDENWQMYSHYRDSFDINGNLVMENLDQLNGTLQNRYYHTYAYNAQNLVVDILKLELYGLSTKQHITYNAQNLIEHTLDSVLKNGSWEPYLKTYYNYDANDSIIEKSRYRWVSSIWVLLDKHKYNYTPALRNDTLLVLDSLLGIEEYQTLTTSFTYNNVDTLVLIQNYNQITHAWDSVYKYTYVYSFSPLRIEEWISYQYGGGWVLSDGNDFLYDSLYRLVHIHNLKPDLCQNDEFYTYNSDGTINIYSISNFCPNSWSELKRKYYYSGGIFNIIIPEELDICTHDSVHIQAVNIFNSPGIHYQWTPSAGLSNDTILDPFVFADTTTSYTLFISDNSGNSDTLFLDVNVKAGPPLNPVVIQLDTIFPCYSYTISADTNNSSPGNYEWFYNGAPIHVPFGGNEVEHSLNGTFTVTVTANNGCTLTDSIAIGFIPPDTIPVIQKDTCNNFIFISYPSGEYFKWVWDGFGVGFSSIDTFNVQWSFNNERISYYVIVEDSAGCLHYSEPVWLNEKYHNNRTYSKEGCGGNCDASIYLAFDTAYSPYTMIWSTGDTTTCINCSSVVHTGHCSGLNIVTITDNEGCVLTDSINILPNLHTLSVSTQLVPDPLQNCSGSITINAASSDTSSNCYICINDTNCAWFHQDTTLQNLCWGVYEIALYNNGCVYTDSVTMDSLALQAIETNNDVISIYPNPVSGFISVFTGTSDKLLLSAYNVTGKLVFKKILTEPLTKLDLRSLSDGIYLITIDDSEKIISRLKLVVTN